MKSRQRNKVLHRILTLMLMLGLMLCMSAAVYAGTTYTEMIDEKYTEDNRLILYPGDTVTLNSSQFGHIYVRGTEDGGYSTGSFSITINDNDELVRDLGSSGVKTFYKRSYEVWTAYRYGTNNDSILFEPKEHNHIFTYTSDAESSSITAKCIVNDQSGCIYKTEGITITLNAPDNLKYDGNPKSVSISGYPDRTVPGLQAIPSGTLVEYYQSTGPGSTSPVATPFSAPSSIGNYVAKMIWQNASVYKAFSIVKGDNPLTYTATQTVTKSFSPSAQNATLAAAENNKGDLSYSINSQKNSSNTDVNYFTLNGTTLTIAGSTPVGTYTVVVRATAAGNTAYESGYKDSTVTVKVNKAAPAAADFVFTPPNNLTYDGSTKTASVTAKNNVTGMGEITTKYYSNNECTTEVAAADVKNTGTYYVGITVTEGGNYRAVTNMMHDDAWKFTITKADVEAPEISSKTYNGETQTASVQDSNLYSVKTNNGGKSVGDYEVVLTLKDPANYKWTDSQEADKTLTFKITKAQAPTVHVPTPDPVTYDPTKKLENVTLPEGWEWGDKTIVPTVNNSGYRAALSVDDSNYEYTGVEGYVSQNHTVTRTVELTVNKATPVYTTPTGLTATYGQTLENVSLSGHEGWAWNDLSTNVGDVGEHSFPATYTPSDTNNYNTVEENLTVTVNQKPLTITGATATNRDYTPNDMSVAISAVTFSDSVELTKDTDYTATGTMDDDTAGENKNVAVSVTLLNSNYSLETSSTTTTVNINKIDHAQAQASGSARYGNSGTVDLSALIEPNGVLGTVTKNDADQVMSDDPTVDADKKLTFSFKDEESNVGKTATVTVPVTGMTNYKDYDITVTLTVANKDVPTLTANAITKTYDGNAVTSDQISGAATFNSNNVEGTWTFKVTDPAQGLTNVVDSGAKTVVFTPADTNTYKSTETTLQLTINRKEVAVKADDKSMVAGDPEPPLTATITGLIDGEDESLIQYSLSREAGTAAGAYTITPSGDAEQGNYAVSYETGTLTITARPSGGEVTDDVQTVVDMINALKEPYDETKVKEAREAYEKLTPEQKKDKRFTDEVMKLLAEAEASVKAGKDKEAAGKVSEMIAAIPDDPSQATSDQVSGAVEAYNSLTPDQKKLITDAELGKLQTALNYPATLLDVHLKSVKAKKGRKAVVEWETDSSVNGYQLFCKARGMKAKKVYIDGSENVTRTVKKLKPGKKFTFKVRTVTKVQNLATGEPMNVYGKWSKARKVKARK